MSEGVGRNMPLAAFDLPASIIASEVAIFRSFYRLAVNNAGGGRYFAAVLLARQHDEDMVQSHPSPFTDPAVEISLHGREG